MLQDIAILTGGQVISEEVGLKLENTDARPARHGPQGRRHQGRDDDRRGRAARTRTSRAASTRSSSEIENTDSDYDREKLQERLAKLSGGVAVIKVGAATEVELKEKKHRIEDAVQTTKAAVEEGVVPGGGVALLQAQAGARHASTLEGDEATGASIVRRALEEPLKQIAVNAGLEGGVVVEKVRALEGAKGLNAATGEYEDCSKSGVIDAAKVTRSALQNAASIAALFLTTEAVVADKPEKAPAMPAAACPAATWTSESDGGIARHRTGPFGAPFRVSRVFGFDRSRLRRKDGRADDGGTRKVRQRAAAAFGVLAHRAPEPIAPSGPGRLPAVQHRRSTRCGSLSPCTPSSKGARVRRARSWCSSSCRRRSSRRSRSVLADRIPRATGARPRATGSRPARTWCWAVCLIEAPAPVAYAAAVLAASAITLTRPAHNADPAQPRGRRRAS